MELTYLTTDELAGRIKYDARTIRERLKDSVGLFKKRARHGWARRRQTEAKLT